LKISQKTTSGLKPLDREKYYWDDQIAGFGVRVAPSGAKTFVFKFREGRGRAARQRKVTIARAEKTDAASARQVAKRYQGFVAMGEYERIGQSVVSAKPRVADLATQYLEEYAPNKKAPKSIRDDAAKITTYILPAIGQVDVDAVTHTQIRKLHLAMAATPYAANRTVALLSKMFSLAEKWDMRALATNPCRGIDKFKETGRDVVLGPEELARLGTALREFERSDGSRFAVVIIQLLLLTGARRSEIEQLKWSEVDWDNNVLRKETSKTGRKRIVLSTEAANLLRALPSNREGWVFPAAFGENHYQGLGKAWRDIRHRAGLDHVRLHDLRHTFATHGVTLSGNASVIGRALGHRSSATTAKYVHIQDDPVRRASQMTTDFIQRALDGDGDD
tara:strand:+ start:161 stop:1333 length:1173 start_codon:yes stop_codon:yes gene_type:complete